jgi:hypothetical protein
MASSEPEPAVASFAVGDTVSLPTDDAVYEIVALDGTEATLRPTLLTFAPVSYLYPRSQSGNERV